MGRSASQLKHADTGVFITAAQTGLENGEAALLQEIICSDLYKGLAEILGWDLLPVLSPHLTTSEKNDEVYINCVKIVNRLAEVGKPKEMMLGLLEQVDRFLDDSVYRDFLKPLQTVLQRIGISKNLFFSQTLDTLYAHVRTLKFPKQESTADQDEKRLMVQDSDYLRIEETMSALLEFVAPFVFLIQQSRELDEANDLEVNPADGTRIEIMRFLLELLDYPLAFVELNEMESESSASGDHETEPWNSVCRSCALQIMTYLKDMNCSFSTLLLYSEQYNKQELDGGKSASSKSGSSGGTKGDDDNKAGASSGTKEDDENNASGSKGDDEGGGSKDDKDVAMEDEDEDEEDNKLPLLGLSCFAYLTIAEEIEAEMLPSVYSPQYLLKVNLVHLASMLSRMEDCAIWKGIELLSSLVAKLEPHTLSSSLLQDNGLYQELPQRLVVIMVRCPSTPVRQKAVRVLPRYISCYDWKGRYRLLRTLLKSTEHTGVCGLLIGKLKDYVHETLEMPKCNEWFTGSHLLELFPLMFTLPIGAETDLLEESDKVLAALNFLRYILLRDPVSDNRSGVWSGLDEVEKVYLSQLHTGLDLSRAHYVQRLKQLIEDAKKSKGEPSSINVTVAGQTLPKMPVQQQMQVLSSAQYTFDLIASVLGRVGELLSAAKKGSS
ncbi:glomulin-like [Amphiura filiformis]|uniref:glomulin-like n=1 Tax=Amphiura filiformis TaxID=82378 RepID=UPI003B2173AD